MQAPLESIHSSGELLSREALQHMNKTAQEVAEQLCIDTKKLETIYLLIVNYSKVLLRSTTNHKEIIDLQELLEQILDKNQAKILEKEIQVIKTIIPLELYGVKVEIQSIFEQLIDNALQFSPQRSSIRLKLARVGNHLTFEIEDEGIGIAPSQRCAAFEPFFRNQSLTNIENKPAPSLGLAIVREYTLRHQGKIEIIDSSPDQLGTRIILKIPIGKNLE
jgi:signal transduction histidine kinase